MTNIGVAPYNPATPVGRVRVTTGDVIYGTITSGQAEYQMFSDADIEAFLVTSDDDILRAAGFGFMALAARASLDSKTIKDYDLSVDLKSLADSLRKQAAEFFKQADEADARLGNLDIFELTRTGRDFTVEELAERENWWWNT
jgi:hypothetical protein